MGLPGAREPVLSLNKSNVLVIKFFKRVFDAYVAGAGQYPLPMGWAV